MPTKMMCGLSWGTHDHSRRSSFNESQAFVENKVEFKSGAFFCRGLAELQECHDKLKVKLGTDTKMCPTREIHVQPLAHNNLYTLPPG